MTVTVNPHEAALLATILAEPAEDAPRLIYADWLDEHNQSARAEFVRVQIERHRLGPEPIQFEGGTARSNKKTGDILFCPEWDEENSHHTPQPGERISVKSVWLSRGAGDTTDLNNLVVVGNRFDGEDLIVLRRDHLSQGPYPFDHARHLNVRAAHLLDHGWYDWFKFPGHAVSLGGAGTVDEVTVGVRTRDVEESPVAVWLRPERGFLAHAMADLDAWAGEPCQDIAIGPVGCRRCGGNALACLGKIVCAVQPIQWAYAHAARPISLPNDAGRTFNWMAGNPEPHSPWFVGRKLWDLLSLPQPTVGGEPMDSKHASTAATARAALSDAMLRLGREGLTGG